jgi:hypothetical protein
MRKIKGETFHAIEEHTGQRELVGSKEPMASTDKQVVPTDAEAIDAQLPIFS